MSVDGVTKLVMSDYPDVTTIWYAKFDALEEMAIPRTAESSTLNLKQLEPGTTLRENQIIQLTQIYWAMLGKPSSHCTYVI